MDLLASLLLFLLPFERIPSWSIGGLTVRLSTLVVLAFILGSYFLIKSKRRFLRLSSLDKAALFYYATVILSVAVATNKKRALLIALLIGFMICAYLLISRAFRQQWDSEKVTTVILWSAFFTALFGIFQFIGDASGLSPHVTGLLPRYTSAVFGFPRIQSVALEPLYYADYLLLPISILAYRIVAIRDKHQLRDLSFFVVIMSVFILTVSRGAYLAVIAIFVLFLAYFIFIFGRTRDVAKGALRVGIGVLLSLIIAYSGVKFFSNNGSAGTTNFGQLATASEDTRGASVNPRLASYKEAWQFFTQHPILGIGVGNYGVLTKMPPCTGCGEYAIVNNQYLETLAETGILGFIGLVAIGLAALFKLAKAVLVERQKGLAVVLLVTLIGVIIQYNFFSTIYFLFLWVLLGLIEALPTKARA